MGLASFVMLLATETWMFIFLVIRILRTAARAHRFQMASISYWSSVFSSIFDGELRLLWTTNVSMVTKWSWRRYILPFHTQSSFQLYLNYSNQVCEPSNDYWRVHILVWMLLQHISDRIRPSRTVQRTYFIIYGFCFTCFTVEYKRWYKYIFKALPMKQ